MKEQSAQTNFNSSLSSLERVDLSLREANLCFVSGDYVLWLKFIGNALKEVIVKINKDEEAELILNEYFKLDDKINRVLKQRNQGIDRNGISLQKNLFEFEYKVRKLLNDKGMLITDKRNDGGM